MSNGNGAASPPDTGATPTAPSQDQTPAPQDQSSPSLLGAHGTVPMISPTGRSYDIPRDKVNDAVNAQWKIGQDMISPNGQRALIPLDRVHDAISQGKFSIVPPPGQPGIPQAPDAVRQDIQKGEQQLAKQGPGTLAGFPGGSPDVPSDQAAMLPGEIALAGAGLGVAGSAGMDAVQTVLPIVTKGVKAFNTWITASPANAVKAYIAYDAFTRFIAPHIPGLREAGQIAGKAIRRYEPPVP